MEAEFENFWKRHQQTLISHAPKTLSDERRNVGKMNTAGDWILFMAPIIAMVWFMEYGFFAKEMLNFIAGLCVGVVVFILAMYIKPSVTGKRSIIDIDQDIRQHFYNIYKEKGLQGLKNLLP